MMALRCILGQLKLAVIPLPQLPKFWDHSVHHHAQLRDAYLKPHEHTSEAWEALSHTLPWEPGSQHSPRSKLCEACKRSQGDSDSVKVYAKILLSAAARTGDHPLESSGR